MNSFSSLLLSPIEHLLNYRKTPEYLKLMAKVTDPLKNDVSSLLSLSIVNGTDKPNITDLYDYSNALSKHGQPFPPGINR